MLRQKIMSMLLHSAMNMAISMTADLLRAIASRSAKVTGPARIRQELNQKGISREATEKAMRECDIDWCALARDQATRKYGEPLPTVFSES